MILYGMKRIFINSALRDLQHENKEDGLFWITYNSFLSEFTKLYVCKTFEMPLWKQIILDGEFKGITAAGMKVGESKIENNPQYSIKVSKPCNLFIKLMQKETDEKDPKMGKIPIYCMLANKNGKRIAVLDKKEVIAHSGRPISLTSVSMETELGSEFNYPRQFTLFVASSRPSSEGTYCIKIYSDAQLKVKLIPLESQYISND